MLQLFEITDDMRNGLSYDGATEKFGFSFSNVNYIAKFASQGLTSELYSEYVASHFIAAIGVPSHDTFLGVYKGRMCVILRDFTTPAQRLRVFKHAIQSSGEMNAVYSNYTLPLIETLIAPYPAIAKRFWEMLVCDAILGNNDRHWGNWGYFSTPDGYLPAPLYDNGGALFPELSSFIEEYNKDHYLFLSSRTCKHPASQLRDAMGRRLSFNTLFHDPEVLQKTEEIRGRLTLGKIREAVTTATSGLPSPYSTVYKQLVVMRYLRIIEKRSVEEAYEESRVFDKS